jgi:hypothetical protein
MIYILLEVLRLQMEPFWTLSYADDPLSWGEERQTHEIYEKMFGYYENLDDYVEGCNKN